MNVVFPSYMYVEKTKFVQKICMYNVDEIDTWYAKVLHAFDVSDFSPKKMETNCFERVSFLLKNKNRITFNSKEGQGKLCHNNLFLFRKLKLQSSSSIGVLV